MRELKIRWIDDEYEIRSGTILVCSGIGRENGQHNLRVLRAAQRREESRSSLEASERAWASGKDGE